MCPGSAFSPLIAHFDSSISLLTAAGRRGEGSGGIRRLVGAPLCSAGAARACGNSADLSEALLTVARS